MNAKISRFIETLRLVRTAYSAYAKQIVILAILGFLSGLFEGIGVNALIPLLAILTGTASGGDDAISQAIAGFFLFLGVDFSLKYILIFIILLFILKAAVTLLFNYIKITIASGYEKQMRTALFRDLLGAQWGYLLKQKLGHFETMMMTNMRFGSELLGQIGDIIILVAGLVIYAAIAVNISPRITLITFVIGLMFFMALRPLISRTRHAARQTANINKEVAHFINENMLGMKSIKAAVTLDTIGSQAAHFFDRLARLRIRTLLLRSFGGSIVQPISLIFIGVIFSISYKLPGFQFVAFVPVVYLIQRIFSYVQQLQSHLHKMVEAGPYVKTILEYEREIRSSQEQAQGVLPFAFRQALEFVDVSFAYAPNQRALSSVSFRMDKGSMVGVVGSSGGGKTTIVDLVLRFYEPASGAIKLDGMPVSKIKLSAWRRAIGYVSQDLFLLNDTIANNIRFHDEAITDADMIRAAKMAFLYEFIESRPQGFDTPVGERGVLLSAGQRQRIVITRALARNPELLILDEATSALDNESEAQIQKVIENLKGKVTVLVIAHRLALIANADTVLVLEKGMIIEQGNPRHLLANPSSALYKLSNAGK